MSGSAAERVRAPARAPGAVAVRRAAAFARSGAAPFAVVVAAALVLRLIDVAAKPFHHDESEHAWFSWLFVTGHGFGYDPVFHGPMQYYLTALSYLLLGIGDFSAHLAPAVMGATVTGLPYLLRRRIGYAAALAAAVLLCISPTYLYFSRFSREDIYAACVTLGLIVTAFAFLARPRRWQPSLLLGLLAVSFATKETTYITVAVAGSFFVVAAAWQARRTGSLRQAPLVATICSVGRDAWLWGAATFLAVYTLLFTTFFTNPHGLQDGLIESIRYWLSQHGVNRGGQPPFYYLVVLPAYEWPVLVLAILGAVAVVRGACPERPPMAREKQVREGRREPSYPEDTGATEDAPSRRFAAASGPADFLGRPLTSPTLFGLFLIWYFLGCLAVYSAAGERMPWLTLHPLLPLVLLAGIGVQELWRRRRFLAGRAGLALAGAAAAWSIWMGVSLSYGHPADAKEMLVFTQTSSDVPGIRDRIVALDRYLVVKNGRRLRIEVDGWGGTGWPWGWYLRDLKAGYPDMSVPDFRPTGEVLLVADPNQPRLAPLLRGYRAHRFRLRVWWVVDYGGGSLGEWAQWLVRRKTWSPQGRLYEWLYVRKGLEPGST